MTRYRIEYVIEKKETPIDPRYPWDVGYQVVDVNVGPATDIRPLEQFATEYDAVAYVNSIAKRRPGY